MGVTGVTGAIAQGFAVLGEQSVAEHIEAVQRQIRANPQNAGLRLALCHFLAVRGEWERAEEQLKRATQLDTTFTPASVTCAMALAAERHRADVWNGTRAPILLGGNAEWVEQLIAAAALPPERTDEAAALRESARQAAPALQGALTQVDRSDSRAAQALDGEPVERTAFTWLCDGDVRLGPVLELLTPTGYAWLPLTEVRRIKFSRPRHLVDLLWAPAETERHDGRALNGLVPVRYPGPLEGLDDDTALGRRTDWLPLAGEEQYAGQGQRTLISEAGDHSMLDLRLIEFNSEGTAA
ncbi:type VI secretion system accessory protein TagJ [Variovorax sp. H27-G14]|uniref:type VI secretion system accessory protein TagJ n=1 Tax=Variovorax sp. H27-G14 TaxID=3111914 RepID=UPI0038FCE595